MEILLSCIEIMQYQTYLREHVDDGDILDLVDDVMFPENIPISKIVSSTIKNDLNGTNHGHQETEKLLRKAKNDAYKLFEKYIMIGSEFEVNISGVMRDGLYDQLSNLELLMDNDAIGVNELFVMFEECKKEMIALQTISLSRFRLEDEFANLQSLFHNV